MAKVPTNPPNDHTPGEWYAEDDRTQGNGGYKLHGWHPKHNRVIHIAAVHPIFLSEAGTAAANARLLRAAPEMYQLLRAYRPAAKAALESIDEERELHTRLGMILDWIDGIGSKP